MEDDQTNIEAEEQSSSETAQQASSAADSATAQLNSSEVAELKAQLEKEKNSKLMAMADLENFRKRVDNEKAKFGLLANMQLVLQLLEIIDDVQMALNDNELSNDRAKEVMEIVQAKLLGAIEAAGLEKVNVNIGDKFDPTFMQAITSVPTDEQEKDNTVLQVISSAFRYKGDNNLLKSAKVIVNQLKH